MKKFSFGPACPPDIVTSECTRCQCLFKGRVQGVGFRYTTRNLAINFDVTGFVRNLPDGRVELVVEGPEGEVVGFIDAVRERMKRHIGDVTRTDGVASGQFPQFTISR